MSFKILSLLALAVLFPVVSASAQPPDTKPIVTTPVNTPPAAVLPMERVHYFIGESVPVAVGVSPARLELVDENGKVAALYDGRETSLQIETAHLAAGRYQIKINGRMSGVAIGLHSTLRTSPAALVDEVLPTGDGGKIEKTLRETGINAVVGVGVSEQGRYAEQDFFAPSQTSVFFNPYTRPMSFVGARVYEPEVETFRHRLALIAQANARYPTFGGFAYDWDPTGFLGRKMLFVYWQWAGQEGALRNYVARSEQAIHDDFFKRTGLRSPSQTDYLRYLLAVKRPEFSPAIDLPTARWISEMSTQFAPLPEAEKLALEKRVDAWSAYLRGIYGDTYAGHQKVLREIMPSLKNTSSVDNQNTVREGQWQPSAYAPLDFRFVEAWNDQISGPDYTFQWLFTAGLVDIGRSSEEPLWVASALAASHDLAKYPGKFMRMAAHNLAYGGRGLGFALEGASNVLGGMNPTTYWENLQGTAGEADLVGGREFLKRFAPLQAASLPVREVGVLLSETQMGRQSLAQSLDTPQFNAFITLARLGYTPRFVTEEQIAQDGLRGLSTLVLVNQSETPPASVMAKLKAFIAGGGRVVRDQNSVLDLPGVQTMDVKMAFLPPGRPFNWQSLNTVETPHALMHEARYAELAPAMLAALGEKNRTLLVPRIGATSKVSTFGLDGGTDAKFVVAVNDAIVDNQANWVRVKEELTPRAASGVLYDLTDEKYLGALAPVEAQFQDRTARVYGILARPVARLDLRATQTVTAGTALQIAVRFADAKGQTLRAALPFHLAIRKPDGSPAQEFYRSTNRDGVFSLNWPIAMNAPAGAWTLQMRSLLDGATAQIPVVVAAGKPLAIAPQSATVTARGTAQIRQLLQSKPVLVAPVFAGEGQGAMLEAAKIAQAVLKAQGVGVEIRETPNASTYTMSYDPTAPEIADNERAASGQSIGKINVTTVNRNDYFGTLSGYIFGKPVLLFDLANSNDNAMAEQLDAAGMLWPKASATFPGKGRATIQIVKSAFKLGVDAIVVQASDGAGLVAGAKALASLPPDRISGGVTQARETLLRQFSIGAAETSGTPGKNLTAKNGKTGKMPQPLALTFPGGVLPPAPSEVKPFVPPALPVAAVPGTIEIKDAIPFYRVGGNWQRAFNPGGSWIGDLRFSEATQVKVESKTASKYRIALQGVFRYSDRSPRSQAQWEDVLALHSATIPKTRRPMKFEVFLDGKPIGKLSQLKTEMREVPLETLPSYIKDKPKSVNEEVVNEVAGEVEVPAGTHTILLVPQNIVDGQLEKIVITQ